MSAEIQFEGSAPWFACTDLVLAVDYYMNNLGFRGTWNWLWGDPPNHAGISRGRTRILLYEDAEAAKRRRGMEHVIYVQNVKGLYAQYCAGEVSIVKELEDRPWGTLDFTVETPDGIRLIFTEAPKWNEEEK